MQDRQKLIESVYAVLTEAEQVESIEAGLGDIVRLEIEIVQLSDPVETFGRTGNFYKMAVEYTLMLEREQEVEAGSSTEEQTHRRTLRLNSAGKVVGVSERL